MKYLIKLILKLVFSLMLLLFINNPIHPLSIFMFKAQQAGWYPLFQPQAVLYYQKLFSFLVLVGIAVAILEYLYRGEIWEVIEEVPNIIGLYLIRSIPKEALNFKEELLERVYPVFFAIMSILILLEAVGLILKIFNYLAVQRDMTKP